jgi:hypothetical protein
MTIDRYTKAVLTVIAVALVVIAVRPYFSGSAVTSALQVTPAQAQTSAVREATIPKAWGGRYIGYGGGNLLLEGPDKSYRVIDLDGKPPEFPKLRWIIKFE